MSRGTHLVAGALRGGGRLAAARPSPALRSDSSPPSSSMKSSELPGSARFLRGAPSVWRPVRRLATGACFLAATRRPRADLRPTHGRDTVRTDPERFRALLAARKWTIKPGLLGGLQWGAALHPELWEGKIGSCLVSLRSSTVEGRGRRAWALPAATARRSRRRRRLMRRCPGSLCYGRQWRGWRGTGGCPPAGPPRRGPCAGQRPVSTPKIPAASVVKGRSAFGAQCVSSCGGGGSESQGLGVTVASMTVYTRV